MAWKLFILKRFRFVFWLENFHDVCHVAARRRWIVPEQWTTEKSQCVSRDKRTKCCQTLTKEVSVFNNFPTVKVEDQVVDAFVGLLLSFWLHVWKLQCLMTDSLGTRIQPRNISLKARFSRLRITYFSLFDSTIHIWLTCRWFLRRRRIAIAANQYLP